MNPIDALIARARQAPPREPAPPPPGFALQATHRGRHGRSTLPPLLRASLVGAACSAAIAVVAVALLHRPAPVPDGLFDLPESTESSLF